MASAEPLWCSNFLYNSIINNSKALPCLPRHSSTLAVSCWWLRSTNTNTKKITTADRTTVSCTNREHSFYIHIQSKIHNNMIVLTTTNRQQFLSRRRTADTVPPAQTSLSFVATKRRRLAGQRPAPKPTVGWRTCIQDAIVCR